MAILMVVHGGSSRAKRWAKRYQQWFQKQQIEARQWFTSGNEPDLLSFQQQLPGISELMVLGGDGTVNSLVNLLTEEQAKQLSLAVIPCGTGNDFARDLGIRRLDWRMQPGSKLTTQTIDIGQCAGYRFVNAASAGLAVELIERQTAWSKRWLGSLSYLLGVVTWWLRYQPAEQKTVLQSVMVGRYLGGGIALAPIANRQDGQLVEVSVLAANRWQLLGVLWSVLRGKHLDHPLTQINKRPQLAVVAGKIEVDGELINNPVDTDIGVLASFLTIKRPK